MKVSRFWLALPWTVFVLLAVGWIAYWNIVAGEARRRLAAWTAAQQTNGADVQIATMRMHGFPVLMRLELDNVVYAPRQRSWRAQTPRLDLNINLLNPQHLIFHQQAPIVIERTDGAHITLRARNLLVSVRTNGGALAEARLEADDFSLADSARDGALRVRKLVAGLRPDPRTAADDQLAVEATALHLAQPVRSFEQFGQDIPTAHVAIVLEHAAGLAAPNDPLGHWIANGGRARVEGWSLTWGPLEATAQGAVTLDAQHRLQGALEIAAPRPAPALNALAQSPNLSHDAKDALRVLALGYSLGGRDVRVHLAAADGVLRLEQLSVRSLAPMY